MNRHTPVAVALLTAAGLLVPPATASAATGEVTVFELETVPLTVWTNPVGCVKLPLAAHVLTNQTDGPVRIYADPFCLTPSLTVEPDHGSPVAPGSGSFEAQG